MRTLITILLTLLAAIGAERAWHTYSWASQVNIEAKAGAAAYKFLATPFIKADGTPLLNAEGKPVTNADVLEALLRHSVK